MTSNVLERRWRRFKSMCLPQNASPTQIKETKKAFQAGMVEMYIILTQEITLLSDRLAEERLTLLDSEVARWGKQFTDQFTNPNPTRRLN